jgi:uncharacterized protein
MTAFSIREFFAKVMALSSKHDHYSDFGWPEDVTFTHLKRMYDRNDLAKAAVKKTTEKTFQNLPKILYGEDESDDIANAFDRLGFWDKLADTDEYAQVGGYAGLILRIADSKRFSEPVDGAYGLDDLVEIIPAWSEQLRVSEWHLDENDTENYGKPKTFTFNEAAITREGANRNVVVHPDRVFVWSATGDVHAPSALLSGYNNLLDMEKISGAGGEGFWKTAAARLNIQIDKDTDFQAFKQAVESTDTSKTFQQILDEKAQKLNKGFDASYISQGMNVGTFSVSLPQPKEFFDIPLSAFAAGRSMPTKILIGMQTGERASTEDAQEWNNTIMSRRNRWTVPSLRGVLQRLERFGMIRGGWDIEWDDLTDDTPQAKLDRADKMADINTKQAATDNQPVFTGEEIRIEAGYEGDVPDVIGDDETEDDQP